MIDMNTNDYYIELPHINWDKQSLIDIMRSYPQSRWRAEDGYTNKYIRPDMHEVFDELYKQFPSLEINIGRTFFAELSPQTLLRPHVDLYRTASINFPLIGKWDKSPVKFHSEKSTKIEHLMCEHVYNDSYPTVINTTQFHSAVNPTSETRYLFSLSVYADWNTIKEVLMNGH